MAKKKLTIEDVLVPKDEIPYEVPENWCWAKLGSISNVISGGTPRTTVEEYYKDGNVSWITPADLSNYNEKYIYEGRRNITQLGLDNSSAKLLSKDSILLSSRAPIGYVAIAGKPLATNQGFKCFEPSSIYLPRYAYWYLKSATSLIESFGSGTTFKEISGKKAALIPMPIPPLAEQERIVNRIESLFDKVDKASELVDEARYGFEKRMAAILERAFSGELTRKWREENGVSDVYKTIADELTHREEIYKGLKKKDKPNFMNYNIDSLSIDEKLPNGWVKCEIGLLCDCIVPGRDKPKNFTGNTPWITIPNLVDNYVGIGYSELCLSEDEIEEVKAKVIPKDSVVMSCVGRFGISSIVKDECVINQQLHAFLPSNLILPKYIMYHIRILKGYMEQTATSTTIAYLNKNNCNSLPINLPSIEEQREIVKILDSILDKESESEYLTDISEVIDATKKSILAKAFRGELGSNDLDEESSVELLNKLF